MMESIHEGGCQCGAVRYRIEGEPLMLAVCHCRECQRQSGSAFGMSLLVRKDHFVMMLGALKHFTRSSDSGRPLVCSFCADCGTRIHHAPSYIKGIFNVKPGTLDDTSWLRPALQSWTASKQAWLEIAGDLPSFERQPSITR